MKFSEWFDVRNTVHLEAYEYFVKNGAFPKDFVPPYVSFEIDTYWQAIVLSKIAQGWLEYKLLEGG